jgi:hypothetical protein
MVPAQSARAITACLVALLSAAPALAQWQPEARAELASAHGTRVELGAGLTWSAGTYLRAGLTATRDVWQSVDSVTAATRAEFAVRFTMDPIAQQRWGFSAGGGVGYRERLYFMAIAELEGPRQAGLRPAFQVALGGGVRLGLVLRRAVQGRR